MADPSHDDEEMRQKKKKRKRNRCYQCGASDHRAKDCPSATCQHCGRPGHSVGGCPDKPPAPVDRGQFQSNSNKKGNVASLFTYIELFAGMGGFRVALDRLGGRCVFASELDRFCIANYQVNFGGDRPAGDITRIQSDWIPSHDLLVGGFPCQPFSCSGKQRGLQDPRGQLFREIVRILQDKQPKAFLLENVRGLYLHNQGKTYQLLQKELEACGYVVKSQLLDAVNLLPQERCRLFIAGIRKDLLADHNKQGYQFPKLPDLCRGVEDILHGNKTPEDELSKEELESLTLTPNQLAKVQAQKYTQEHPEARFLMDTTKPAKTLQSSYTKYMVGSQFVPVQDNDNTPAWRRFSSREAARLQGFPEAFQLCQQRPYHMLGNAVAPPLIAMIVAPLLHCIGALPSTTTTSGWDITRDMLLAASPNDPRREKLRQQLTEVDLGKSETTTT
ncbi:methylase DsaV [Seminavis robusta]|uniref:Cytosine-specific methyltransferase n=1 Tax=Seminavis robusta TaxID=568900 RepID=A0A9N8EYR0_9STRA|nr:methylase DsaV [Seminavis robusta]|eukprot:Sro2923_g340310.1 methylase DsaV (446) ;mRNA; r:3749-5086